MSRQWKILIIAKTTKEAEADLRQLCANKIRGPYIIDDRGDKLRIGVIMDNDMDFVLSAADVIDRTLNEFMHDHGGAHMADSAWDDYIKSLSRH